MGKVEETPTNHNIQLTMPMMSYHPDSRGGRLWHVFGTALYRCCQDVETWNGPYIMSRRKDGKKQAGQMA